MEMKRDEIVIELLKSANENGLVDTIGTVFGECIKVSISFSKRVCDTSIDELDFSVRARNAMKRANIFTIGEAIDLISGDGLLQIRNLGKKTQNEIKTLILLYGYENLSENEKKLFFYDLIEKNTRDI